MTYYKDYPLSILNRRLLKERRKLADWQASLNEMKKDEHILGPPTSKFVARGAEIQFRIDSLKYGISKLTPASTGD